MRGGGGAEAGVLLCLFDSGASYTRVQAEGPFLHTPATPENAKYKTICLMLVFDSFFLFSVLIIFLLLGQQWCIWSAYVNGDAADQLSSADGPQDGQDHRFYSRHRGGQRLRTPGRELKQTDIFAQL